MVDAETSKTGEIAGTIETTEKTKTQEKDQERLQELLTNMDATIYRLNILCNRFEKDKDLILKEGVDIKDAVKSLQTEISAFAKMRGEIGKTLTNTINLASETIVREADESIKLALNSNIENTIQRLNAAVTNAHDKFQYFYDLDKKRLIWTALGLIVLPVVTGVLVAKMFMSEPIMRFNKATCEVYKQRCF